MSLSRQNLNRFKFKCNAVHFSPLSQAPFNPHPNALQTPCFASVGRDLSRHWYDVTRRGEPRPTTNLILRPARTAPSITLPTARRSLDRGVHLGNAQHEKGAVRRKKVSQVPLLPNLTFGRWTPRSGLSACSGERQTPYAASVGRDLSRHWPGIEAAG
jgi:hypothetical protein